MTDNNKEGLIFGFTREEMEERQANGKKKQLEQWEKAQEKLDLFQLIIDDYYDIDEKGKTEELEKLATEYNKKHPEDSENPICCICGTFCEEEHGHNPKPVIEEEGKRCCLCCNHRIVSLRKMGRNAKNITNDKGFKDMIELLKKQD